MNAAFVELTRVEGQTRGTPVLVNMANVVWIEPETNGTSRIVFAGDTLRSQTPEDRPMLTVRESARSIATLIGMSLGSDREAIAQAWLDQQGRRDVADEG